VRAEPKADGIARSTKSPASNHPYYPRPRPRLSTHGENAIIPDHIFRRIMQQGGHIAIFDCPAPWGFISPEKGFRPDSPACSATE